MQELSPFPIWQTTRTAVQAQTQRYELACPNIHPIYDLLEYVKGPDPQIQSCRISTTQGGAWNVHEEPQWRLRIECEVNIRGLKIV